MAEVKWHRKKGGNGIHDKLYNLPDKMATNFKETMGNKGEVLIILYFNTCKICDISMQNSSHKFDF